LKDNDIVIVTDKLEDWWIGECNNVAGKFPPNCVAELVEAKPTGAALFVLFSISISNCIYSSIQNKQKNSSTKDIVT